MKIIKDTRIKANNLKFNPQQVVSARQYRGYSQTELADNIKGLTREKLSKFEKGIGEITQCQLKDISLLLNFPTAFFEMDESIETFVDINLKHNYERY